jgi:hypothetical protein
MRFIYLNGEPTNITSAQETTLTRLAQRYNVPQDKTGAVMLARNFSGEDALLPMMNNVTGPFVVAVEPDGYSYTAFGEEPDDFTHI